MVKCTWIVMGCLEIKWVLFFPYAWNKIESYICEKLFSTHAFEFVDESHYLILTKSGSYLSLGYVKDEFVITSKIIIFACLLVYGMTMSYGYWHNTKSNYLRNCLNYRHLIIFFPISHQKLNLAKNNSKLFVQIQFYPQHDVNNWHLLLTSVSFELSISLIKSTI